MMISYPATEQFREIITSVTKHPHRNTEENGKPFPILRFQGTVKLHGTNAAIVYQKGFGFRCQSRNTIITPDKDNAGFARYIYPFAQEFLGRQILPSSSQIKRHYDRRSSIVIYGEWCGSNIQRNVAICGCLKMFVIFKVRIGDAEPPLWLDPKQWLNVWWPEKRVFNIYEFPTYAVDIDFNQPELARDRLIEITEEVERQCPVGAYFNQKGIGEGVVWTEWAQTSGLLTFKVKGKEHAVIKAVRIVEIEAEKFDALDAFVTYACTENRMRQALDYLREQQLDIEVENLDEFLDWLIADISKEEGQTISKSNLNSKNIANAVKKTAGVWFYNQLSAR